MFLFVSCCLRPEDFQALSVVPEQFQSNFYTNDVGVVHVPLAVSDRFPCSFATIFLQIILVSFIEEVSRSTGGFRAVSEHFSSNLFSTDTDAPH